MPQFIYSMRDLRKVTAQGKELLRGINLSFFYGAKIGVLGANGAGKSTLLQALWRASTPTSSATPFTAPKEYSIGFVPQEPQPSTSRSRPSGEQRRCKGWREMRAIAAPAPKSSAMKFGEDLSDEEMDQSPRTSSDEGTRRHRPPPDAWDLDRHLEIAKDAHAPSARRTRR